MTTLAELMGHTAEKGPRPLPEAQVLELRQIAEHYRLPCPFKVGDLVTPRENSPVYPKGDPWIVVEVRERTEPSFAGVDSGSSGYGARPDFRAIVLSPSDSRSYVAFWNESWQFDPYQPKGGQS